jgi:hypothetical protein
VKFRIGAGTLITVLLALVIGGYGVYQQRRLAAQPPVVERVVQGATPAGIAPVPEFLLRHRAALALSDAQVKRLHAIAAAYRKDVAPYQQQMHTASAGYQHKVEVAQHGKRPSLQQLQNAGGDVQQLSSVVVTTRHAYWQQARAVLTARQQAQADALVSLATLRDLE